MYGSRYADAFGILQISFWASADQYDSKVGSSDLVLMC